MVVAGVKSLNHVWLLQLHGCTPSGSSVHGIFQARILEWVAISSPRGPSWPRDWTRISCLAGKYTYLPLPSESRNRQTTADQMQLTAYVCKVCQPRIVHTFLNDCRGAGEEIRTETFDDAGVEIMWNSNFTVDKYRSYNAPASPQFRTSLKDHIHRVGWVCCDGTNLSIHPTLHLLFSDVDLYIQFSSLQLLSSVRLFATPRITARQASLSITNSRSSLKLMSIESVMPSSHLIVCRPLLLLAPIPPSIRVFSNESTLRMRWPKYWSFSFNINPSNEHLGLIFRIDWLDLLAVQGTLKSLLQYHSSKASILQCSAFFITP